MGALSSLLLHATPLSGGRRWPSKPGAPARGDTWGKRQAPILGMSRVASPAWLDLTVLRLPCSRHRLWVGPSVPPGKCTSPGVGGRGCTLDAEWPARGGSRGALGPAHQRLETLQAGQQARATVFSLSPRTLAPALLASPCSEAPPSLGPHLHLSRALRKLTGGIFCHTQAWPVVPGGGPIIPVPGLVPPRPCGAPTSSDTSE